MHGAAVVVATVATVATVAADTIGTAAAAVVVVEFTDALSLRAKEFLFGSQENRSAAEGPWEEVMRRV